MVLPIPNKEMEDLLVALKKVNPNLVFLRSITMSNNKEALMVVSRFENSEPITLEEVFREETVNFKPDNLGETAKNNYKLISYKSYLKEGKLLYTKVSNPVSGQCAVMYYFMKKNLGTVIYEIKLAGAISEIDSLKTMAETIALSVEL